MTDTKKQEEDDVPLAGDNGEQRVVSWDVSVKALTKDADFFGPQKPMDYVEPTEDEREFYFMECEKVIFHAGGKALHKTEGSGEVPLPAHVGVTVIRGRSRAERR